jgi:hypothetical protein
MQAIFTILFLLLPPEAMLIYVKEIQRLFSNQLSDYIPTLLQLTNRVTYKANDKTMEQFDLP